MVFQSQLDAIQNGAKVVLDTAHYQPFLSHNKTINNIIK